MNDEWLHLYFFMLDLIDLALISMCFRRMFPLVQVNVSGLNPILHYAVLLEFQLTNHHRWRFLNGEWTAAGSFNSTEPPRPSSIYVHTSSPLTGQEWMRQKIIFSRVKLSNKEDGLGKVNLKPVYIERSSKNIAIYYQALYKYNLVLSSKHVYTKICLSW